MKIVRNVICGSRECPRYYSCGMAMANSACGQVINYYTFYHKKDAFGREHVGRFIIKYMPVSPTIENDPYTGEFSVDIFGRIYAMNHVNNENGLIANSLDDFIQKAAGHHYQVCGVAFAYDGIYDWDEDSHRWVYDYYLASFDRPIKYDENGVIPVQYPFDD